ncbi:MAG: glycosyltransferase family 92 protein [Acidimicrobiales bacterium]
MAVVSYTPSPIALDPAGSLRRELPPDAVLHAAPGPVEGDPAAGFDHTTLFYDFAASPRGDQIVAVGPPMLNLRDALLPATFCLSSTAGSLVALAQRWEEHPQCCILRLRVPRSARQSVGGGAVLLARLRDGTTHQVRLNRVDRSSRYLSLSTIQRDEPLPWVREWIAYWASLGADRVVLYDNGSTYFEELVELLGDLGQRVEIVVVRWHFPYGPTHSFDLLFAQAASLNHARLVFPGARWGATFDIDEYPVLRQDAGFPGLLDRMRAGTGAVRLRVFDVKNVRWHPESASAMPTAKDFVFRDRASKPTFKYLYRTRWTRLNRVHDAVVWPFVSTVVDPEEAAYFHYWALNRGWKHPERIDRVAFDPSQHVEDQAVADRMRALPAV